MKKCIFENCDRIGVMVKGLCDGHYRQHLRKKPLKPLRPIPVKNTAKCVVHWCENVRSSRNLCNKHLVLWYRNKRIVTLSQLELVTFFNLPTLKGPIR